MPTSKVIRPAVFDETGEHVIPADADLNLDPVSSDPDNYIVRGSDGGAFLNGDGVLSNDGENLLKTAPNDGKVTYPRSDAVSLITETVQPFLDTIDGEAASAQIAADKAQAAADKAQATADKADEDAASAQTSADKAQAAADKAQASADQAKDDAAAAQCTATQALNDAADAQADADKAQARADAAYDKASDAQCAAADALDKAQEATDKLPEIADSHSSIVTAGDGIKVDQSKLGDHNVYQVSVKPAGADSGIKTSTDGVEVDLKSGGGLSKDNDGLGVDQQWIDEIVARYAKDHMLFNQFKIVKQLPEIPDADVHTLYLIRNKDSSAADVGTKDSFNGWFIATTENGTQKWEEIGYKTDLTGYTHAGNTVKLTGDTSGTGTVDANGNVVVPTAVSHAASADKTTGGTVNITGYVSGSGSFDRNGNVTVDVVANIKDTPYTYYVGKTNARDYWGKDENGNMWGSTKDHPFASLSYAINQSNSHIFPGNTIKIYVNDSGEYADGADIFVTSHTIIRGTTSEHPVFRGGWDMYLSTKLELSAVDFAITKAPTTDSFPDGVPFFRVTGSGELHIANGCHMVIDNDNFGKNTWPFIIMGWHSGSSRLRFYCNNGPALYLELRGNGVTHKAPYIEFSSNGSFGEPGATGPMAAIKLVSPSGTKHTGPVLGLGRFTSAYLFDTPLIHHKMYFDWDIADDSGTSQVDLGRFAALGLYKNPDKGQALPGSSVGNVPDLAEYYQREYA